MSERTCHCGIEEDKHEHEDHAFVELREGPPEPTPVTQWLLRRVVSRSRSRYAGMLIGTVDGLRVETTPIVSIEGRTVTTRSGSVYILTGPDFWGRDVEPDEFPYPFYLDADGDEVWPAGGVVPEVSDVY